MRCSIICFFLMLGLLVSNVFAGEVREIELSDGSVIYGEIISFSEGIFTLKSRSLGTLKIEESKIHAIRSKGSVGKRGNQIEALRQKMMSDKEIVDMILTLQNDPDVQRVLQDPDIMKAVSSGDIEALLSNPKFMKLLDNPTIQAIRRKVVE